MCTTATSHESGVKRILVAVDDSAPSRWAVQTAGELAGRLGAGVLLLHVVVPQTAVMDVPITAEELDETARREGSMLLERMRELLPASAHVDCMQLTGLPAEEIVAAAENSEAQFVVMGTRGRGRLSHLLLGSTADAVIRQSACPVITVSQEPKFARGGKPCCGKCGGERRAAAAAAAGNALTELR